jgi:hypothetical protein
MWALKRHNQNHRHHHDGHEFERLEGRLGTIAAAIALLIGLAMALGLMSANGHVTW